RPTEVSDHSDRQQVVVVGPHASRLTSCPSTRLYICGLRPTVIGNAETVAGQLRWLGYCLCEHCALAQAIALLRRVENAPDAHGPLNVASGSLPPPAVRPMREYGLWQWPSP